MVRQGTGTENSQAAIPDSVKLTVGVAVLPETFEKIRIANGAPPLADAPSDQDVLEFELEYSESDLPHIRLDILTTKAPGGNGAIARFLGKFGEGIQQVELDVTNVDRATEILRTRFQLEPIYPATRPGANGTRVNFFLVPTQDNQKVLRRTRRAAEASVGQASQAGEKRQLSFRRAGLAEESAFSSYCGEADPSLRSG